jgi:hypothetical protein
MGDVSRRSERPDRVVMGSGIERSGAAEKTAPETTQDGQLDAVAEGRVCWTESKSRNGLVGGVRGLCRLLVSPGALSWGGELFHLWNCIQVSFAFGELHEEILCAETGAVFNC